MIKLEVSTAEVMSESFVHVMFSHVRQLPSLISDFVLGVLAPGDQMKYVINLKMKLQISLDIIGNLWDNPGNRAEIWLIKSLKVQYVSAVAENIQN